jgi:hypothetical protein
MMLVLTMMIPMNEHLIAVTRQARWSYFQMSTWQQDSGERRGGGDTNRQIDRAQHTWDGRVPSTGRLSALAPRSDTNIAFHIIITIILATRARSLALGKEGMDMI